MADHAHSPLRIAVGLALTGCAFVVAGRHTHRGLLSPLPPVGSSAGESLAESPAQARAQAPAQAPIPPEPPGAPSQDSSAPVRRQGSRPSDQAVAFDAVMSRVTTLIDAASRSDIGRHTPTTSPSNPRTEKQAEEKETEMSPTAPSMSVATLVRPDSAMAELDARAESDAMAELEAMAEGKDVTEEIASKAALFLAGNAPPAAKFSLWAEETIRALRRTGLGDDIVGPVSRGLRRGTDLETLLLEAFAGLAPAPPAPRRAGSLLVVVGAADEARYLARAVAVEIGTDPDDVALASLDADRGTVAADRLVRTAVEGAERAPGWRRSQPAVVVVEVPLTSEARPWARHVIASLRPTAVWGVVASTCKSEDIASWASDLGGLDALALENLGTTVSPGTALGVGVPVARLDGRVATAQGWCDAVVGALTSVDLADLP